LQKDQPSIDQVHSSLEKSESFPCVEVTFKELEKIVPNLRALAKNSSSKHLEESQYEEINCLIKVFDNSVQILRILNQIIHQGHLESFRKICNNRELFQEIKSSDNDFFAANGYKKVNNLTLFVWNDHDFDFYIRENSVMSKNFDRYDTIRDMCERIEKHFQN
jgi:hypothetical protein